ncbi:hypothetical protein X777_07494, partial [Ooceraea biroi]
FAQIHKIIEIDGIIFRLGISKRHSEDELEDEKLEYEPSMLPYPPDPPPLPAAYPPFVKLRCRSILKSLSGFHGFIPVNLSGGG